MVDDLTLLAPWVDVGIRVGEGPLRFSIKRGTPAEVRFALVRMLWPCVACGKPIHPVRISGKGWYVAVCCDLKTNISCSRTSRAHQAVDKLARELKTIQETSGQIPESVI